MSDAPPPEASTEYSRGDPASRGAVATPMQGAADPAPAPPTPLQAVLFAGALLGALLLFVAEFTTLYEVHAATSSSPIATHGTGANHAYAMAVIAVCAVVLGVAVWRSGSRPALLGVGILGLVALLIALLGDLPDARATGLLTVGGRYVEASTTPSAGLYMETLGAVILLVTCISGFILVGGPERPAQRSAV